MPDPPVPTLPQATTRTCGRTHVNDDGRWHTAGVTTGTPRFLQLADVAEVLNISSAQAYALVRSGDLPAIKVGGRGQWRVESSVLEDYIARLYRETRDFVDTHPFARAEAELPGDA